MLAQLSLAVALGLVGSASAQEGSAPADQPVVEEVEFEVVEDLEAIGEIEEIQLVELVEVGPSESGPAAETRGMGVTTVVGRMHPALVHVPLAGVMLLALMELLGLLRPALRADRCTLAVLAFTALGALPTVGSGLLRAGELAARGMPAGAVSEHRSVMIAVAGLACLASMLRLLRAEPLDGGLRVAYLAGIGLLAALAALGGHLGGKLVYGPDYLPF